MSYYLQRCSGQRSQWPFPWLEKTNTLGNQRDSDPKTHQDISCQVAKCELLIPEHAMDFRIILILNVLAYSYIPNKSEGKCVNIFQKYLHKGKYRLTLHFECIGIIM